MQGNELFSVLKNKEVVHFVVQQEHDIRYAPIQKNPHHFNNAPASWRSKQFAGSGKKILFDDWKGQDSALLDPTEFGFQRKSGNPFIGYPIIPYIPVAARIGDGTKKEQKQHQCGQLMKMQEQKYQLRPWNLESQPRLRPNEKEGHQNYGNKYPRSYSMVNTEVPKTPPIEMTDEELLAIVAPPNLFYDKQREINVLNYRDMTLNDDKITTMKSKRLSVQQSPTNIFQKDVANHSRNYNQSPAAIHATYDGSLDNKRTGFNQYMKRKLKMKDSFGTIFPTYTHNQVSTFDHLNNETQAKDSLAYHSHFTEGHKVSQVDKEFHNKNYEMKTIKNSLLPIRDALTRGNKKFV